MVPLVQDPWETGVLRQDVHARLVARSAAVAADAGIPAPYIWNPLEPVCTRPDEQVWVRRIKFHRQDGYAGLIYLGPGWEPPVDERMCGIAGALTRNFIRARVMVLDSVIEHLKAGEAPEATCLLLPTFCQDREKLEGWKQSLLQDLLVSRLQDGQSQTVLWATSMEAVSKLYGTFVHDHIACHYQSLKRTV